MTKTLACTAIAAIVAATTVTSMASADVFTVTVLLSGAEEVPSTPSTATGYADVTIDTITRFVQVSGEFFNLMAPVTAAHLHGLAAPGVSAGIIFGFTVPVGSLSGTLSGSSILSEVQFQGLMDGLTYVNVHSQMFPGGEIRGQVIVPAPASLLALAALPFAGRRRRG